MFDNKFVADEDDCSDCGFHDDDDDHRYDDLDDDDNNESIDSSDNRRIDAALWEINWSWLRQSQTPLSSLCRHPLSNNLMMMMMTMMLMVVMITMMMMIFIICVFDLYYWL